MKSISSLRGWKVSKRMDEVMERGLFLKKFKKNISFPRKRKGLLAYCGFKEIFLENKSLSISPILILVDTEVKDMPLSKTILSHFSGIETRVVENEEKEIEQNLGNKFYAQTQGKSILYLAKNRGKLLKPCPGTTHYLCCGYWVLNSIENCSMECTYCILQCYLNNPVIKIHTEIEEMKKEISHILKENPKKLLRIGSGELSDSLLYDPITKFSHTIIEFLKNYENVLFEFKTKTTNIENLLNLDFTPKNIVVAWSLNTPLVVSREENKTTSLTDRLHAAELCQKKGYKIAFHFDPIILYENCCEEYRRVVDEIFQRIHPRNIAWISLGMLRYPPSLHQVIQRRFPKSKIIYGETVQGNDGKIRYLKKHRMETFQAIYRQIYQHAGKEVFVYLCMESQEIWKKVLGFSPVDNADFKRIFHQSLIQKFSLPCDS